MQFANRRWEIASHGLEKHCAHVLAAGPWRWKCGLQNGSLLAIDASLSEGFLHLATWPDVSSPTAPTPESALRANANLRGGVRLALDLSSRNLHLRADLPVVDELQLAGALESTASGFHGGVMAIAALDTEPEPAPSDASGWHANKLAEVMRDVNWPHSPRSAHEFSAELDVESAPPATLRFRDGRLEAEVDLVRSNAVSGAVGQALAVFLLTANSHLCFCRACSEPAQDQEIYRLQSCLSATPAPEEVENALAALSVAYRLCARETNVLLNEGAAETYLSVRNLNPQSRSAGKKEE
jgi:hypothetical protein